MDEYAFSTPMMNQYVEIKKNYQDCLLFFRLGDFYELFLDDAKTGAQALNITLTSRPRGKDGDIPMAGVPYHAADVYIAKLVKLGHKVAICEQVSEPDKHGIVDREVVRIITPGTVLDEKSLDKKEHNYTVALSIEGEFLAIAAADLSTGDFQTTQVPIDGSLQQVLTNILIRFTPSECILSPTRYSDGDLIKLLKGDQGMNIYAFSQWDTYAQDGKQYIKKLFSLSTLSGWGLEDKLLSIQTSAALLGYLEQTQKRKVSHIQAITWYDVGDYLQIDRSSVINLELFETIRGQTKKGSVLAALDRTVTPMGGRMLKDWFLRPLRTKEEISARHDCIDELVSNPDVRDKLQDHLKKIYDIERLLSRISVDIATPPDLVALKQSLAGTLETISILHTTAAVYMKEDLISREKNIRLLWQFLENTILDRPSIDPKEGDVIKTGVHPRLDKLRVQIGVDKDWVKNMEESEKKRTGISSLKIRYNKVFGYFIEVSKSYLPQVPKEYIRRQTLVNAERFVTEELTSYEERIVHGEEEIYALEYALFEKAKKKVLVQTSILQRLSKQIAVIDCLISFAIIAEQNRYIRPQINTEDIIEIEEGRHPVVEEAIGTHHFVPNDVLLQKNDHQLLIITGPNMAGKSVYIRQVAVIVLLAHIGSFVPAKKANISLIDKLFVRSGASDVISSGLSTFMVEMVETAYILQQATKKSLIIMDEVGRGTSTYDGISIAWAIAEYLVTHPKVAAKTLFATHYHELHQLEDHYPKKIKNYHVAVNDEAGSPIFLHKVVRGRARQSYGVEVARLAGLPHEVVEKAQELLQTFYTVDDVVISGNAHIVSDKERATISETIKNISIHNLTPLEALDLLDTLQKKVLSYGDNT